MKHILLRRPWRLILLILVCLLLIAGVGTAIWLRPFPPDRVALDALHSGNGITVSETGDHIVFQPERPVAETKKVGILFYPGARIEPAAYALYMRKFAEQGYTAIIVKMPLNLAILGQARGSDSIKAYPAITSWIIGGHSLGGAMACRFAANHSEVHGLFLYGAYCETNLSQRADLATSSLYGTKDAITTLDDINQTKKLLPSTTRYMPISGGIHSFFGDYGLQDGDGLPSITREQARNKIIEGSLDFFHQVTNNRKK